jgi:hypothetical protein
MTAADARRLEWLHRVDPDAWWAAVVAGSPLTGSLIHRQQPDAAAVIKRHYDTGVTPYAEPGTGRVALPAVAVLGSGRRPVN